MLKTYYQRCVITCDTLAVLHRRPRLQHLPVAALTQAIKPDSRYRLRIAISATPSPFHAPIRGGWFSSEYCYAVWHGNLENDNGVATGW